MLLQLVNNILRKPWAIDPNYAEGIMPFVAGLLNHEEVTWKEIKSAEPYAVIEGRTSPASIKEAPKGSLAVIKMSGPLQKEDQFCGPVGMESIGKWIEEADNNTNIDGIILQIDSPGGTVDGTETLARIVSSTKKPIVAFADGTMASAAYWIGSAADEVVANGKTTMVGSIGTMMRFADIQPVLEKAGVKFHEVFASKSTDKNRSFNQARNEGNYESLRSEFLDPLNEVFLSTVEANRKDKLNLKKENVLSGKMYHAEPAKSYGLIDKIGSFDTAVKSLRNLIDNKSKSKMSKATKAPAFASFLGWDNGFEASEEGVHIQLADVVKIDTALSMAAEQMKEVTGLTELNTAANATIESLKEEVGKAKADAIEWKAKADKYATMSGKGTKLAATADVIPGSTGKEPSYLSDASDINKWFDSKTKHLKKEPA